MTDGHHWRLPDGVLGMSERGPEWAAWVAALPALTRDLLQQWDLRVDGWLMHGNCSLVAPVLDSSGSPAVLKIAFPDDESEHEHLALSRWAGDGAVRLLRAALCRLHCRARPRCLPRLE